jgi:hypothetical protein
MQTVLQEGFFVSQFVQYWVTVDADHLIGLFRFWQKRWFTGQLISLL